MRKSAFVISLMLGTVLGTACLALADTKQWDERPRCHECGMYADTSSAHVQADTSELGKRETRDFCGLGCLFATLKQGGGKAALSNLRIVDYTTYKRKLPKMLEGQKAWYLYGTADLPGTMEPYIAAFSTKDDALKAQPDLGGELLEGWDAVFKRLIADKEAADEAATEQSSKVASKEDPAPAETVYVCPCTGGCCDDITSDKPGECPKCGMQLVPKSEKDAG
jgi:hypothetical protein